ncbi:DUF6538 domain-containing protein [Halorhodospira halophila]|uniref:DUF6538 domain-containing protein n=1 Tax=Halorhodospira halophila TaxID=1053 RepID=UPI00191277C9|nr:DUF6538 domain-containing protein [Halorhodospira halophila]
MYYIRKVVPTHLRNVVGKRELKQSLQTKDPREAKLRAPAVLAQFDQTLAGAEQGLRLGPQDLQALARKAYEERFAEILEKARREDWDLAVFEGCLESHDTIREPWPYFGLFTDSVMLMCPSSARNPPLPTMLRPARAGRSGEGPRA